MQVLSCPIGVTRAKSGLRQEVDNVIGVGRFGRRTLRPILPSQRLYSSNRAEYAPSSSSGIRFTIPKCMWEGHAIPGATWTIPEKG